MIRPVSAFALLAAGLVAAPVHAQDSDERVNMVIVYGDDDCPASTDDVITVCARKAESERYRIPENLRTSSSPENVAWAERVERLETVGKFGTMSCSPTGPGGITGCTQEMVDAAYKDRAEGSDVRFGQLIEAARAERLSTIDADAADEQARVEELEKAYMQKLEAERAAPLPGEAEVSDAPPAEGADAPEE